jgi:hypothetical protein
MARARSWREVREEAVASGRLKGLRSLSVLVSFVPRFEFTGRQRSARATGCARPLSQRATPASPRSSAETSNAPRSTVRAYFAAIGARPIIAKFEISASRSRSLRAVCPWSGSERERVVKQVHEALVNVHGDSSAQLAGSLMAQFGRKTWIESRHADARGTRR